MRIATETSHHDYRADPDTKQFRDNFDAIFGEKKFNVQEEKNAEDNSPT